MSLQRGNNYSLETNQKLYQTAYKYIYYYKLITLENVNRMSNKQIWQIDVCNFVRYGKKQTNCKMNATINRV